MFFNQSTYLRSLTWRLRRSPFCSIFPEFMLSLKFGKRHVARKLIPDPQDAGSNHTAPPVATPTMDIQTMVLLVHDPDQIGDEIGGGFVIEDLGIRDREIKELNVGIEVEKVLSIVVAF